MYNRTIAILPAYNEVPDYYRDSCIDDVLSAVLTAKKKEIIHGIVTVNDGSSDFTASRLAEYRQKGLHIMHHLKYTGEPENRGKLRAFLTGLSYAWQENAEIILCVDADIKNLDPGALSSLIKPLRSIRYDMAVATYRQGDSLCPYSLSGLRAIRLDALRPWLDPSHKDYEVWRSLLKDKIMETSNISYTSTPEENPFEGRKKITIGYSLETFLEGLSRIYNLNSWSLPYSGLISRKGGEGPCPMEEINFGIGWATTLLKDVFSSYNLDFCD